MLHVFRLKAGLHCDISISTSINISKDKHNECSHLLHKRKEIDIRKRNELQNETAGVLDELCFQNGGRRQNSRPFSCCYC